PSFSRKSSSRSSRLFLLLIWIVPASTRLGPSSTRAQPVVTDAGSIPRILLVVAPAVTATTVHFFLIDQLHKAGARRLHVFECGLSADVVHKLNYLLRLRLCLLLLRLHHFAPPQSPPGPLA